MKSFVVLDSAVASHLPVEIQDGFDRLGVESGQAQCLTGPISSTDKFRDSNHVAIAIVIDGKPVGFAKVGSKDLFFYTKQGRVLERRGVPCLLDFFVSESLQRSGIGKILFDKVLEMQDVHPKQLAYDRPSPKLTSFLSRHYQLIDGDLQPNRFMIFEGFLD